MTRTERVKRAEEIALERVEYIIRTTTTPDFVEIVGDMGGDVLTYRIYDDGRCYQR